MRKLRTELEGIQQPLVEEDDGGTETNPCAEEDVSKGASEAGNARANSHNVDRRVDGGSSRRLRLVDVGDGENR